MKPIEFRMDAGAVAPLIDYVRPLLAELEDDLAGSKPAPDEDEGMESFWRTDLLDSQRSDVAALASLFDDEFQETGRATLAPECAEPLMRGCAALRLLLRERSLGSITDEQLEGGEVELDELSPDQRTGYLAYLFFGSLQEFTIHYLDGQL